MRLAHLEERFQSLEHDSPDVVVEPPEGGAHFPIRNLNPLKDYVDGLGYLRLQVATTKCQQGHWPCAQLQMLISEHPHVLNLGVGDSQRMLRHGIGVKRDLAMLFPVIHFVEQPKGMLIQRLPSRVWCQLANLRTHVPVEEADSGV